MELFRDVVVNLEITLIRIVGLRGDINRIVDWLIIDRCGIEFRREEIRGNNVFLRLGYLVIWVRLASNRIF